MKSGIMNINLPIKEITSLAVNMGEDDKIGTMELFMKESGRMT